MLPIVGTLLFAPEPERECWHEAGHCVTAYHLGIRVAAIGFTWNNGEDAEPNPCAWVETATVDQERAAIYLFGGMAAEILKLNDYDYYARASDMQAFKQLGCPLPDERYLQQAIDILIERDSALIRVCDELIKRRVNPQSRRFKDTDDVWRQVHLKEDEFEALM
jgi:hypothetical protein